MTAIVVMGSAPLPPNSSGIGSPCTPKFGAFLPAVVRERSLAIALDHVVVELVPGKLDGGGL